MPPKSRVYRNRPNAPENKSNGEDVDRPAKAQKTNRRASAAATPKPTALSAPASHPTRQTRRASVKKISYEESDSQDEPDDGNVRESSSEIIIDAPPKKGRRNATPSPPQDTPSESQQSFPSKIESAPTKKWQPLRGNWSVSHLLQSEKSKLKDCDLETLLCNPKAWSSLSLQEQHELCAMLPNPDLSDTTTTNTSPEPLPNLPQQLIKSNPTFRSHLRLFQEELAAGRFDPTWLSDAQTAMKKRAAGTFDDWKESEREKFWGQKQKVSWLATAGDSAKWSLFDMARGGYFQVGDVWVVSRGVRRANGSLTVQKEATLLAIAEDWTLSFSFPPGQHGLSAPTNGPDKRVDGVDNPNALAKAITIEDGRIPATHRSANAWREVRCLRRNQDMGSLWDVRETFHNKQSVK